MSVVMIPGIRHETSTNELEQLFRDYHHLIYRTAYSVTGRHQDAEDILQGIFLRLMKRDIPPDLRAHPTTYLYRAAVNASLTIIRTRQRQRLEDGVDLLQLPLADKTRDVNNELLERQLRNAMAQLNSNALEILILRYEHGYSDAEIAKTLGKSRVTIAVALHRVRARLRRLLRNTGEEQ